MKLFILMLILCTGCVTSRTVMAKEVRVEDRRTIVAQSDTIYYIITNEGCSLELKEPSWQHVDSGMKITSSHWECP